MRLGGLAAHEAASDAAAGVASAVLARHRVRASLHGPYELTLDAPPPDAPEVWRSASVVALVEGGGSSEGGEGGLLCGGAEASFVATIAMPRLWAAEVPALYTLVLELLIDPAGDDSSSRNDSSGGSGSGSGVARGTAAPAVVDVEACRVGLRLVSISGEQLRVNGVPLEVRGVNRHEHSAERGKAVSWAEMVADALLLKRFNFNAVRTSHYPNAVRVPAATCPSATMPLAYALLPLVLLLRPCPAPMPHPSLSPAACCGRVVASSCRVVVMWRRHVVVVVVGRGVGLVRIRVRW